MKTIYTFISIVFGVRCQITGRREDAIVAISQRFLYALFLARLSFWSPVIWHSTDLDVLGPPTLHRLPIDLSPYEWNFDLDMPGQKFHHSLKEDHKISNIPKFRCEMLQNADNIALRILPFFSHFALVKSQAAQSYPVLLIYYVISLYNRHNSIMKSTYMCSQLWPFITSFFLAGSR
jgi:hypothetical protein